VAEPHDTGTSARLDALRRGLYRPGSTEADLRQYLDERDAVVQPAPGDAARPPVRPRRRLLVVATAGGLAVVLVLALTLALGRSAPRAESTSAVPTATATAGPPVVMDVGDGQTLTVPAGDVTSSTAVVTSLRSTPVVGRLFEGVGNAVVSVDPPADLLRPGSAVVVITSSSRVPVAWRALSRLRLGRAISEPLVLARGISAEPSSTSAPQTFDYQAESPPARVAVAAPAGARWSLLIAVADERTAPH
jgi:hypothetical protein